MATPLKPRSERKALTSVVVLGTLATAAVLVIGVVADGTRQRISENQQAWLRPILERLIVPQRHDNDMLADHVEVTAPDLLGSARPVPIYRARLLGKPSAVVIRAVAPDGYGGPIELLVAISVTGRLLGVDVLRHRETRGLGDDFENDGARWLRQFAGRSLQDPAPIRWKVRKDGGEFDQLTGATITPRAIVNAVRRTLEYYEQNSTAIWSTDAQ